MSRMSRPVIADIVNAEEVGYAVLLTRDSDGAPFLAYRGSIPALFFRRRDAVAFRDELVAHVKERGRVVKVRLRCDIIG